MVGVRFTAAGLAAVLTFASKPLLGINPIALAAPARREAPVLFDAATSAIAGNKIRLAIRLGSPLLPGWVTDKDGVLIVELCVRKRWASSMAARKAAATTGPTHGAERSRGRRESWTARCSMVASEYASCRLRGRRRASSGATTESK